MTKDDLFCEIVGDFMDRLNAIIKEHYSHEVKEADRGYENEHDDSLDFECTKKLVHEIYKHRDEHNAFICKAMCKANDVHMVDKKVVHWMSHSQVDMFIFMVTHIDNEKEALAFAEKGMEYLIAGWYAIVK